MNVVLPEMDGRLLTTAISRKAESPRSDALITRVKQRLAGFFKKRDAQLADNEYVAGSRYSIADITALCGVDFAGWTDITIPPDCTNVKRWYDQVSARPSAKA